MSNFTVVPVTVAAGLADTEITITHSLGAVPKGYLTISRSRAGTLYLGPTAWTATTAYLKSDTANTLYTILLFT